LHRRPTSHTDCDIVCHLSRFTVEEFPGEIQRGDDRELGIESEHRRNGFVALTIGLGPSAICVSSADRDHIATDAARGFVRTILQSASASFETLNFFLGPIESGG